jgi:predicted RecA/RadA family phage recombinase
MKNYIQEGDSLTVTASYDRTSGQGMLVGAMFGVVMADVLSGGTVAMAREGVFDLTKVSAQAWTQGEIIYWDDSAKECTTTATSNTPIGFAALAAANPSSTGRVVVEPLIAVS